MTSRICHRYGRISGVSFGPLGRVSVITSKERADMPENHDWQGAS